MSATRPRSDTYTHRQHLLECTLVEIGGRSIPGVPAVVTQAALDLAREPSRDELRALGRRA